MVEPTHLSQNAKFEAVQADAIADIQDTLGDEALFNDADLEELESLQQEVGLVEVPYDPAMLEAIATEEPDDEDLRAASEGELISDLPQEMTESYGTGLQGQPSDRAGSYSRRSDKHLAQDADPSLTGGDIDANYEQAEAVGDEAVGGTVSTPDQDIVDEVAAAVGLELDDRTDVRISAILEERDDRRWELDPKSSEDYGDRRD